MTTISSSTTSTTAYKVSADTTGTLVLQTGATPTTAVTISSAQVVTLANALPVASGGTGTTSTTFANLTTNVTGTLPVANGGTGVTTSTGSGANVLDTSPSISGAVLSSMASSVITSGTAVATTSGTSIDFTGIPSWVKRVTINFQGVSTNGTAEPLIKIGTSGGIQSSGYLGASCFLAVGSMGSRPYSTAPASSTGYAFFNDLTAAALRNGVVTLTLLNSSNGTWALQGMLGNSAENFLLISAGSKTLSGTLDRVRITTTNGTNTFDAGTINILYE